MFRRLTTFTKKKLWHSCKIVTTIHQWSLGVLRSHFSDPNDTMMVCYVSRMEFIDWMTIVFVSNLWMVHQNKLSIWGWVLHGYTTQMVTTWGWSFSRCILKSTHLKGPNDGAPHRRFVHLSRAVFWGQILSNSSVVTTVLIFGWYSYEFSRVYRPEHWKMIRKGRTLRAK